MGLGAIAVWLATVAAASGQVTERVSVSSTGSQGNLGADLPPFSGGVVSSGGRYVAFMSASNNLVPGDTNGHWDVFARDRVNATTQMVSVDPSGAGGNANSGDYGLSISQDGRYVAFMSRATNLIAGGTNGANQVFLRDLQNRTTELVSVASGGAQGDGHSEYPVLSSDVRYVAFTSFATNLVTGDTNGAWDVFVRDRQRRVTERVSIATSGSQGNSDSYVPAISGDGRYVAFESIATNLVPGDTNGFRDVFVRDRQTGTTERVSVDSNGVQGNGISYAASISANGRYVGFSSMASNLVPGDTNGTWDAFVRDLLSGTTERVSIGMGGVEGNGTSGAPSLSADGRYAAFGSVASNLVSMDLNGAGDAFLRDRQMGTTELVSLSTAGRPTDRDSWLPLISPDGRFVAFSSDATNLVAGDTNGHTDVFVRDRFATGFTSLCDPGMNGVVTCPCGNPPGGPDRGCDNSSGTGGASLSASGIAYLSIDSLVFTTSGEKPTATSVLLQGTTGPAYGILYGQGVRCVGGSLKRLFVKSAIAGSITAPEFSASDPTVSARSAALGDVIQPGQSRWYLVYYRDPTVLGGCPASSTFNATQTGRIDWSL